MIININDKQKEFILKAIWSISLLYNFDISDKEFKESYNISRTDLIKESNALSEVLR